MTSRRSRTPFVFHITLSNPSRDVGSDHLPHGHDDTEDVTVIGTGSTTQKQVLLNLTNSVNATIAMVNGFQARGTGVIQP